MTTTMEEHQAAAVNVVSANALETIIRGEVDMQVSTAKKYPRSIQKFKSLAMSMATLDEETASGCFYSLPRGGKPIEGPSARLAEIVTAAWGNMRSQARVVSVGQEFVTAQGVCWDLETNSAISVDVQRRITDKRGNRFNADMIGVTANAACSIALRNAVFKIVPMVYTREIYEAARKVAIGDVKTLASRRATMMQYFGKMGVPEDRVLARIGKPSVEDIGLEEVAMLKGMAQALKDGDADIDEMFPDPKVNASNGGKIDDRGNAAGNLAADLKASAGGSGSPSTTEPKSPVDMKQPAGETKPPQGEATAKKSDEKTNSSSSSKEPSGASGPVAAEGEPVHPQSPADDLPEFKDFTSFESWINEYAMDNSIGESKAATAIGKLRVADAGSGKARIGIPARHTVAEAIVAGHFDWETGTVKPTA